MKKNDVFPSRYLVAADLQGTDQTVTIKDVALADMGDDTEKPVIAFFDCEKGLACNVTNWSIIEEMYGEESDDWRGKKITIYPTKVDFKGKRVAAIRVRDTKPNGKAAQKAQPGPAEEFDEFDSPSQGRKVVDNGSNHGSSKYASQAQTDAYLTAVEGEKGLRTVWLAKWFDRWTRKDGEIPEGVKEPCTKWQLDNHLIKWAIGQGFLQNGSIPAGGPKPSQVGRLTALVFHASKERKSKLRIELLSYLEKAEATALAHLQNSNPELFEPTETAPDEAVADDTWEEGRE